MKKIINITFVLFAIMCSSDTNGQTWDAIGPFNRTAVGGGPMQGAGRVKTIAFHPDYNTNTTFFAGSPYGGIWITRDDGVSWSTSDPTYPNLTTDFLPGCGVTDIVIDYNDPTIMYAATSVAEFQGSVFKNGPLPPNVEIKNYYPATGIYKYTPAAGWVPIITYPYHANISVMALTLDPLDPTKLFASTSDGILKFTGSGTSWTNVLPTGGGAPFRNVVFDPTDPLKVFASGQDVYESTDGGTNWSSTSTSILSSLTGNLGVKLINIVVKSSTTIYASIIYKKTTGDKYEFYKYNGSSWTALPMFSIYAEWNPDRFPLTLKTIAGTDYVFAGQELTHRYSSSANSWTTISGSSNMHYDIHDIVFSPGDPSTSLVVAHDGGVSKATLSFSGTPNWATKNSGLHIATVYSFAGAQRNPELFLTGEQDNGDSYFAGTAWSGYQITDGGDKMISWDNPNEWYDRASMYGGSGIVKNTTGIPTYSAPLVFSNSTIDPVPTGVWTAHYLGEEFHHAKPLVMDPNNTNVVYRAASSLLRSTNSGATSEVLFNKEDCFPQATMDYYGHVTSIAIAPSNSNYLYINFHNGYEWDTQFYDHIYKTTNALTTTYKGACAHSPTDGVVCGNWVDLTPPFSSTDLAVLKKSEINCVIVSDKEPGTIWAAFSYNPGMPQFQVWKYDGQWYNYGAGLPINTSITSLVYERGSNDGIYAGTDVGGVYYRNKSMSSWIAYGTGLPHAKIVKMEINNTENTLRVGMYGRGIWKTSLYCPTDPLVINGCTNCNNATDYFWEGTTVTISNTTLNTYKHFIRGADEVDILPDTEFNPSGNPDVSYDVYIHGCDPNHGNTYKTVGEDVDNETISTKKPEEHHDGILIYPNPNNGSFTLNTGNEHSKDVYVYNVLGRVVYQQTGSTALKLEINISDTPKGLYIVKIMEGEEIQTIKYINQ